MMMAWNWSDKRFRFPTKNWSGINAKLTDKGIAPLKRQILNV